MHHAKVTRDPPNAGSIIPIYYKIKKKETLNVSFTPQGSHILKTEVENKHSNNHERIEVPKYKSCFPLKHKGFLGLI
jgi:hypothetical protein